MEIKYTEDEEAIKSYLILKFGSLRTAYRYALKKRHEFTELEIQTLVKYRDEVMNQLEKVLLEVVND